MEPVIEEITPIAVLDTATGFASSLLDSECAG